MSNQYERGLGKNPANYASLTPVSFLQRSAGIFPDKAAVIDDDMTLTYSDLYRRCRRMASALTNLGIKAGDTVSVLCFNTHELLESHYAIPMTGAVLNALNTRLDAATLRFILEHGDSRLLFYDTEFEPLVEQVVARMESPPLLVAIARMAGASQGLSALTYEDMVAAGDPEFAWTPVGDEWDAIALNYTSGTTGNPKGVVYHHRGAYLAAMSNAMAFNMNADTVYLWTLPMFHCNGWGYTWAITAVGGTHVCLRKVQADHVLARIENHHVTHLCGAPIVLNMLLNDFHKSGQSLSAPVQFALGGAAPPSPVIYRAQEVGFRITHLYGLTESYGPSALCVWQDDWEGLATEALARKMARQGVGTLAIDELAVAGLEDGLRVPADGQTLGELVMRGNTLMKGYLKNEAATQEAFRDGWFHTGDLAVMHPDGYVEIKDRAKDIIISGGENISSQEIEEVLYRHPMVLEAAVVAMNDEKWGEVPCAFITLKDGETADAQAFIAFCKENMASFKAPKHIVFGELPKTSTGKIRKNLLRDQLTQPGGT
ncbi:long-chain-fatty-acid--CoA ligase [Pusillimonas sp. SM2304]|uniref:long-chain-fatty-acid--CoA ligase n=1 Tax=Pusillimonas sp. SM2304 TaxID=3073241 RepID=UPI002876C654|nr:long-chain-fatty-acid--CoA ligase [Pusillimonas sp. SM2304]MDS1140837.1 long-chain-fatty-acid--CoA ligase [Pusillimonas sp. SM2304]